MVKSDATYYYFFEVDSERRYDFAQTFGPTDLYNYIAPVDEDDVDFRSTTCSEKIIPS